MNKNTERYLNNFDFLRIIFTVCIVYHHLFNYYNKSNMGGASVEFFFILSGFFLTYTIEQQKNLEVFIVKKIIKFWPLICFSSICLIFGDKSMTYEKFLAPLFFLPATGIFDSFSSAPNSAWYICVLIWVSMFYFYIIKNCNPVFTKICIAILTFYNYVICVKYDWGIYDTIGELKIFTIGMARGIAGMGCGYFIAALYNKHRQSLNTSKKTYLKYTVSEIFLIAYILISMFGFNALDNRIFLVIAFIALIWLFLIKKGTISCYFEKNPYKDISQYCLAIFLTHGVIIFYSKKYMSTCTESDALQMSIIFFTSVLFGVLVRHFIEKPTTKYLQSKIFKL